MKSTKPSAHGIPVQRAAAQASCAITLLIVGTSAALAMDAPSLPTDNTARVNMVMRAAAKQYPDLIRADGFGRTYHLYIVVRADGTIYNSDLIFRPPPPSLGPSTSVTRVASAKDSSKEVFLGSPMGEKAVFEKDQPIADVGKASDEILVTWSILPANLDESRSARRVADAVRAKHTNLMLPTMDRDQTKVLTRINMLTIFMSEDGQIAREFVEPILITEWRAMNPRPQDMGSILSGAHVPPSVPVGAFKVLGLQAEQIGQTGLVSVAPEPRNPNLVPPVPRGQSGEQLRERINELEQALQQRTVIVRYAWPRRPGEPVSQATTQVDLFGM